MQGSLDTGGNIPSGASAMTGRDLLCAVAVRARGLRHRRADARLRTRLRHDPAGPALVLSPHLDDATLNCWSVLTGPSHAVVATVFTGMPRAGLLTGWDALCGASDSAAIMRERLAEDREALALAGAEPVHAGFLDAQYRGCRALPPLAAVDAAIADSVPAVSAVYAPLGTGHGDHRYVRRFAAALGRCGLPVRIYAEIPYVTPYGWPEWVTGRPEDPRLRVGVHVDGLLASVPHVGEASDAQVVRLSPDQAAAKLEALRHYRTQFPALDQGPLQAISRPEIHGFEVFWPLAGAYTLAGPGA
jgi:LmbE family N-acetylglucosaminyl deacetylase